MSDRMDIYVYWEMKCYQQLKYLQNDANFLPKTRTVIDHKIPYSVSKAGLSSQTFKSSLNLKAATDSVIWMRAEKSDIRSYERNER